MSIVVMIVMDNHYVLRALIPSCLPSCPRASSGQMASAITIVAASCNIKNEMQSFSERGNVLHKKNKQT